MSTSGDVSSAIGKLYVYPSHGSWSRYCTGALVGPRHVLTSADCAVITDTNGPNPVAAHTKFFAGYKHGHAPYGEAHGTSMKYHRKHPECPSPPCTSSNLDVAFDYVIQILDRRVGDQGAGWFGTKAYSPNWNNQDVFTIAGYKDETFDKTYNQDITSTLTYVHGGQTNYYMTTDNTEIEYNAGSPLYGAWDGQYYVVGLKTGHYPANGPNAHVVFSGGPGLNQLILQARTQYP